MAYLAPKLVRVHNAGKLGDSAESRHGLMNPEARDWDARKVRLAVFGLLELENVGEIVINIPNWPAWMDADEDGFLDDDKTTGYVDLVGRFAGLVWELPGARERIMFEITNERDNLYHEDLVSRKEKPRVAELARIYIRCAKRIREVAPGARVGGPSALNSYNSAFHEQFIAYAAPELDFYSMHLYVSGDSKRVRLTHPLPRGFRHSTGQVGETHPRKKLQRPRDSAFTERV